MKKLTLLFPLLIILHAISYSQSFSGSFEFEGRTRNYEVCIPQNFHANMPIVFILHGYTESISFMKDFSKMHEAADTMGYITVYPKSATISWNSGETDPPWEMYDTTVNDVGFFSTLIDTLYNHYDINLNRIYVCGQFSGGEMAFRLATELGYRFVAVASVGGPLNEVIGRVKPIRPFPILHMHGTDDPFISYYNPPYNLWSVEETLNFWIENNECISQADTIALPDIDTTDESTVEKISYTKCSGDTKVIHYKVIGGGHSWPGSTYPIGGADPINYNTNKDINASVEILNFFKNYENPLINLAFCNNVIVYPNYTTFGEDSLTLLAQLYNPEDHTVKVLAYIEAENSDYNDSLELQVSNDSLDNFYQSKKLLSDQNKDFYKVSIRTTDFDENISTISPFHGYFTNVGPLVAGDTIVFGYYDEWSYLQQFKFTIKNTDTTTAVSDVNVRISTDDERINMMGNNYSEFYDIPASGVSICKNNFSLSFVNETIKPSLTKENPIKIKLDIYSKNRLLWIDTLDFYYSELVDVEKSDYSINTFNLYQNYPNPFNPITTIKYSIPKQSYVTIKIFDVLGKEVKTLVNEEKPAGTYKLIWNAANLPSGVYFYQLRSGDFRETKKMILLK